jgi:epoxyqueuosine reductase QueG
MTIDAKENNSWIEELSKQWGATLFGVADVNPLKEGFLLSTHETKNLKYAISIAVSLSRAVLDGIENKPTLLYKWHYRQANNQLDRIAFLVSQHICEKGFCALPIPASQIVDWDAQKAHVSHRTIGEAAGLGWRGKNNLLVNPEYGAQIRLVTVLTNIPLFVNKPLVYSCGSCSRCVQACPVGALGENANDYDFEKCFHYLKKCSVERGIGQYICGVCVRACPGKRTCR